MGEIRLTESGVLSADLTDMHIQLSGSLVPLKQLYQVQRVFEGGGDPEGHLELVLIREFPAVAPSETPSTPTASAEADWDVTVSIGVNPTAYWRRVSLWEYPADTFIEEAWIPPGLGTSSAFDFDVAMDGTMLRARVQYAASENSPYPGPYSLPSNVVTLSGGM